MHTVRPHMQGLTRIAFAGLLGACAQLPPSVATLDWQDRWGDRGAGVLARDYAMCSELLEQKRSLMGSCMAGRGWEIR